MMFHELDLGKRAAELIRSGASFIIAHSAGAWLRVNTIHMDAPGIASGCLVSVVRRTRQTGIIYITVGDGASEAAILAVLAHELGHWLLAASGLERVRFSYRRLVKGKSGEEGDGAAEDELDAWRIARDLFDWDRIENGGGIFEDQLRRNAGTYFSDPERVSLSGRDEAASAAARLLPLRIC